MTGRVLCALADIALGESRGFDPDRTGQHTMFVVRRADGVFAYADDCPHHPGAAMAWRRHAYMSADGANITCHGHGALFDIETGLCVHGPCAGRFLRRVPVVVSEAGELLLA